MSSDPQPEEPTMDKTKRGLYRKFTVTRTDGASSPGGKHDGCDYFVLDITHDPHAAAALMSYAASCEGGYPMLAHDLRERVAFADAIDPNASWNRRQPPLLEAARQSVADYVDGQPRVQPEGLSLITSTGVTLSVDRYNELVTAEDDIAKSATETIALWCRRWQEQKDRADAAEAELEKLKGWTVQANYSPSDRRAFLTATQPLREKSDVE